MVTKVASRVNYQDLEAEARRLDLAEGVLTDKVNRQAVRALKKAAKINQPPRQRLASVLKILHRPGGLHALTVLGDDLFCSHPHRHN